MKIKKRTSTLSKILPAGAVLVFSVFFLNSALKDRPLLIAHHNPIDAKISQYSDTHINQNAVIADPQFKNLAFNESAPAKSSFWGEQAATVIRAVKSLTAPLMEERAAKEYGSWIWTPVASMSTQYMESVLSGAKADGVNTMYISIDTYLDIFTMPKGPARESQKKAYSDKLEDFITRANQKGIQVDAEAGWRNWAEDDNIYKGLAIVNYVKNFNNSHQNKFRGFQYDVEPYLLDSYEKDKETVLKNFVKLVDQTENFIGSDPLSFSVVVPDFYDEKDALTPKFAYNGKKDYTFKHLLGILDRKENGSIIVMSYRNTATGSDGTIEISNNEMQTANKHNTKIIIAQETGDVAPAYITFYNRPKEYFAKEISLINGAYDSYSNFGGIAVHYVNSFLALK